MEAQLIAYTITEVRGPKLKYLQTLYYIFNIKYNIIIYNNIFLFGSVSSVHSNLPPKTEPKFLFLYIIKPKPNQNFCNDSVSLKWFFQFLGFLHTLT